jgi:hypothetical protein
MAHSFLGGSGVHRWSQCSGQPNLARTLPAEAYKSSVWAEEGSDAHAYAAERLRGGLWTSVHDIGVPIEVDEGGGKKRIVKPDKDMVEHIGSYLEYCWADRRGEDLEWVEVRFDLSEVYPGCFGTADYVRYRPSTGVLRVIDLKYGAGKAVSPVDNPQLKYYALGALLHLKLKGVKRVSLEIFQPRIEYLDSPASTWDIGVADLVDFSADLADAAAATEKPDAPLKQGEWCLWCPCQRWCPNWNASLKRAADIALKPVKDGGINETASAQMALVNMDNLAFVLEHRSVLLALVKAGDELAYSMAMSGVKIPGYKIVEKIGRRKYALEGGDLVAMLRAKSVPDSAIFEPPEVRSPARLERQTVPGVDMKAIVAGIVTKESTGYALVPDDDKRPAAVLPQSSDALKAVGVVKTGNPLVDEIPDFLRRDAHLVSNDRHTAPAVADERG